MTDHEIKHTGFQNLGYLVRDDGEVVLTNFDRSKPAWIINPPDDPEELERVQQTIQKARRRAREAMHGPDEPGTGGA